MDEKLEQFKTWIEESERIVFFGGAGVSTESGIPDFRSVDGLYNQKYKFPPETILSRNFYVNNLSDFYEFYREKMLCLDAKPNSAHYALAKLEQMGKLTAVVTQNIDGLHYAAGSKTVYELHGSVHRNYCLRCGKQHDAAYIKGITDGPPPCSDCGGLVKPDVVLYGEGLNQDTVNGAIEAIENADMLIIGGTSLTVQPACSLINYFSGDKLVLINKTPTPQDDKAGLLIQDSIGKAFSVVDMI
ncbi:MAG: NAD-dependent protein deacylase [Oscillospiraceae bacterium]|nr:NAD-dependent protein deacylase [Oscillospiraceae bacterium]